MCCPISGVETGPQIVEEEVDGAPGDSGDSLHIEVETQRGVSLKRSALLAAAADIAQYFGQVPGDEVDTIVRQRAARNRRRTVAG